MQRAPGQGASTSSKSSGAATGSSSQGLPLPSGVRRQMESAYGSDFSGVRVRESGEPERLGARSFARGEEIAFAPGEFRPASPSGLELLGHELAHVEQQRQGRVSSSGSSGGLAVNRSVALEREAWDAGKAAAAGRAVTTRETSGSAAASSSVTQLAGPLTDAVTAVNAHGPSPGSAMITENLVTGIRSAEGEFLRMRPDNRFAEWIGASDTVGPGQLGQPAITSVDSNFSAAATAFEAIHGPAPSGWQAKATDANWSYFYIAAYLAFSINEAHRVFHPSTPVLTDAELGILDLGIAMYHGAFETVRDMRRRVARERGINTSEVTLAMLDEELRSGTATLQEQGLERYNMTVRGSWDFGFEIQAKLPRSRRFDIVDGKVKVTVTANYASATPASGSRATHMDVQLQKFEVACGFGGACAEGTNPIGSAVSYPIGSTAHYEWTGLAPGAYTLMIRKDEDPYSPDVLTGTGHVETRY